MIVETRDGREYVVFKNPCGTEYALNDNCDKNYDLIIVNSDTKSWNDLDRHDEDMCLKDYSNGDIMKVYIPHHPYSFMDIGYEKGMRKLIWEREEIKKMTMKDLEEHFGCKIKIVES